MGQGISYKEIVIEFKVLLDSTVGSILIQHPVLLCLQLCFLKKSIKYFMYLFSPIYPTLPPFALSNHKFVLYVYDSISILWIVHLYPFYILQVNASIWYLSLT